MMMTDRALFTLTTLCLAAACGPTPGVGSGSSGSSGSTGNPSPTNPNPTNPNPNPTPDPDTTAGTTSGSTTGPDPTGGPGSCCEASEMPGCDDPAIVDCVCELEPQCCAFGWGAGCVSLAQNDCDAVCDDPGTSTGEPTTGSSSTGVPGADCDDVMQIEMMPDQAIYSGAWELGMSGLGEGQISVIGFGGNTDGSFIYEVDIPCNDTWYIWARYFDDGADDSYLAMLDGEPMPPAIFEGSCNGAGNGYDWARLNWRDQGDGPCVYIEDPWAPQWDAGLHQIEFSYRESPAMGRILLINDPDFVPM